MPKQRPIPAMPILREPSGCLRDVAAQQDAWVKSSSALGAASRQSPPDQRNINAQYITAAVLPIAGHLDRSGLRQPVVHRGRHQKAGQAVGGAEVAHAQASGVVVM